jgi:Family of unknown function (DUF6338)
MAELSFTTVAILLILLPGFTAARIVQQLCVRPEQTEFDKIFESLFYSFAIYVFYIAFFEPSVPVSLIVRTIDGAEHYSVDFQQKPILYIFGIAAALGLLVSVNITNDLSGRLFRKIKFSDRSLRTSTWGDVLHDFNGVVQIELEDGRRIMGWLRYYSDNPEGALIFLENAAWIDRTNNHAKIPVKGPGVLLTAETKIKYIEFLDSKRTGLSIAAASGKV